MRRWLAGLIVFLASLAHAQQTIPGLATAWNPVTQYTIGQQVTFNYALWGATVQNAGLQPPANPGQWVLLLGNSSNANTNENLQFSASPVFSILTYSSHMPLNGNVSSFVLPAGGDGQSKCLAFSHDGTGTIYTITPPANVVGFMLVGLKHSSQCFTYYTADSLWIANTPGVITQ